jgi:hypothetical protein
MSFKEILNNEVKRGQEGLNISIPFNSLPKVSNYIDVRKSVYTLLFSFSGAGKTMLTNNMYILDPIEYVLDNPEKNIDISIIYFSMERHPKFAFQKWLSRKIYRETGTLISTNKMFGWKDQRMNEYEQGLYDTYLPYLEKLESNLHVISGAKTPEYIENYLDKYAKAIGRFEKDGENTIFIENNPNMITLVVIDHQSIIEPSAAYPNKKAAIDRTSTILQKFRDTCYFSPVMVAQTNRSFGGKISRNEDAEPTADDIMDSSRPEKDADLILSIYDPYRFKIFTGPSGHDINQCIDDYGANFYRYLKIIKSSYGPDQIGFPLAFHGAIGDFQEFPKIVEGVQLTADVYKYYTSGEAFIIKKNLNNKINLQF